MLPRSFEIIQICLVSYTTQHNLVCQRRWKCRTKLALYFVCGVVLYTDPCWKWSEWPEPPPTSEPPPPLGLRQQRSINLAERQKPPPGLGTMLTILAATPSAFTKLLIRLHKGNISTPERLCMCFPADYRLTPQAMRLPWVHGRLPVFDISFPQWCPSLLLSPPLSIYLSLSPLSLFACQGDLEMQLPFLWEPSLTLSCHS